MRKYLMITGLIMPVLFLMFSCQKEKLPLNEPSEAVAEDHQGNDHNNGKKCRLVHADFGNGTGWDFHYNNKGLADRWDVDLGGGMIFKYTMNYDNHGKMKSAVTDQGVFGTYDIKFVYHGDKVVREIWRVRPTNDLWSDTYNFYDHKGRMTRRHDILTDTRVVVNYDNNKNVVKHNFFIGNVLYYEDLYTYNIPNKNPSLAAHGLPYEFAYWAGDISRWLFTGDKYIAYDGLGGSFVIYDYDPALTCMDLRRNDYVKTADYFDRVTNAWLYQEFTYDNCGRDHNNHHGNNDNDKAIKPRKNPEVHSISRDVHRIMARGANPKESIIALAKRMKK